MNHPLGGSGNPPRELVGRGNLARDKVCVHAAHALITRGGPIGNTWRRGNHPGGGIGGPVGRQVGVKISRPAPSHDRGSGSSLAAKHPL